MGAKRTDVLVLLKLDTGHNNTGQDGHGKRCPLLNMGRLSNVSGFSLLSDLINNYYIKLLYFVPTSEYGSNSVRLHALPSGASAVRRSGVKFRSNYFIN